MILQRIQSSDDLKQLNRDEISQLCSEIRHELVHTVSVNGGHLASNLGIVELTVAIHRIYNTPTDKIIFDVGHQCYVHKLITGRFHDFKTLRTYGGLSGFPKKSESVYDSFETGHASTAISAAAGFARARDLKNEHFHVIAVVGDGALTGGMCYEALNDIGNQKTQLTVILNDNEMSIAPNVGALSSYLTHLRISSGWQSAKKKVRKLTDIPFIGKPLYKVIHGSKKILKTILMKNNTDIGFFEALGFQYFGPIDGHDINSLEETLNRAKEYDRPCVIHVLTKKGYGYEQAEKRPEAFHGTPPFYVENGNRLKEPDYPSAGHQMADCLSEMADQDNRIIAVTAAMPLGTGLDHFAVRHPDRLVDVGIAEEHAVTMAAGMAACGMRPYFAVYASFFQRCYDQMIHDVCMQHLPVVFLLDRSGIGGEDGQTHHGVFDFASLLPIPGITVLAPCEPAELKAMLQWTIRQDQPVAVRYSKDGAPLPISVSEGNAVFEAGRWKILKCGKDITLLAVGSMVRIALCVSDILKEHGLQTEVVNCSTVKPLDKEFLENLVPDKHYFTLEEHMLTGGFGEYVTSFCHHSGYRIPDHCFGIPDVFIQHGRHDLLLKDAGLAPEQISCKILDCLERGEHSGREGKS